MKPKEIRDLSVEEIEQRIAEDEREMSQLLFRQAVAGLENPLVLRTLRRDIARLKTILKQKQADGATA
jgi:large subunit ribosomal protein L29